MTIEWGNKSFNRKLKEEHFNCDMADSWIPRIEWTTDRFIGLGYGCGSPCWGLKLLPMNSTDSVETRLYDLSVDPKRNLVVYLDDDILTIENLITGIKQEIKANFVCTSASWVYCIDSVKLQSENLYVKWNEMDREGNTKQKIVEQIQLKENLLATRH